MLIRSFLQSWPEGRLEKRVNVGGAISLLSGILQGGHDTLKELVKFTVYSNFALLLPTPPQHGGHKGKDFVVCLRSYSSPPETPTPTLPQVQTGASTTTQDTLIWGNLNILTANDQ